MPDQTFVLVAEDEELVRLVIVQALLDEGFEVMEVEHAEAALIVLESHGRRIHVLFTDIQMPGAMDGLALAHHTSKHWPWIGLLVTSGRPHFLGKADLWRSHTSTAMSFVIFASWQRRLNASEGGGSSVAGTDRRLCCRIGPAPKAAVCDEDKTVMGKQRLVCRIACRPQSVSVLWRLPWASLLARAGQKYGKSSFRTCRETSAAGRNRRPKPSWQAKA
jgi:hypothetical protein